MSDLKREGLAPQRSRRIYLLPNALTTASLFAGFYAIVQAMNQHFEQAAVAVFVSMVLDGLDGRVARLTNTQSAFGEQYDSLSDMVAFGVAPAVMVYEWSLRGLGKWGWIAAFIYVAGAALRLARFNTNVGVVDRRFFQGLPSPASGALIAGLIWVVTDLGKPNGSPRPAPTWPGWPGPSRFMRASRWCPTRRFTVLRHSTSAGACRSCSCWRWYWFLRWCRLTRRSFCSRCFWSTAYRDTPCGFGVGPGVIPVRRHPPVCRRGLAARSSSRQATSALTAC